MSVKYIYIFIFALVTSIVSISSIDLKCEFKFLDFTTIGSQYTCLAINDLKIEDSSAIIDNIEGTHKDSKSIDSITALTIENADIHFIPSNLGEKMPNLVALKISNGKLKELHQNDLKSYTKLMYLNLDGNQIEVLEDGLFEFNPNLKLIWFYNNKIRKIGSSVFSNLKSLTSLDLSKNVCISKRPRVLNAAVLSEIIEKCSDKPAEDEIKIETTTIVSSDQIYQAKINKLESRILEVMLVNSKNQEEIKEQQNMLANKNKPESNREYETNKIIFKLETDLKVETAKAQMLKQKLSQKESELASMSDDLSKAHESIRRFETEIALNYAPLRRSDRAEISKLEAEKAEMKRNIGHLLVMLNQLKEESEVEMQNAKQEIEALKILLLKDETQEVEIAIDESKLEELPNAKENAEEIALLTKELKINASTSTQAATEVVSTSSENLESTTIWDGSETSTSIDSSSTDSSTATEVSSDYVDENLFTTTNEPQDSAEISENTEATNMDDIEGSTSADSNETSKIEEVSRKNSDFSKLSLVETDKETET